MDKKTYSVPGIECFILSMGGVVCTSPTTYETTLEDWKEEEIN